MTDLDGIQVVTEPTREYLDERQLVDYRSHREACLEWLLTFGKRPDRADGYAFQTVKARASRMDIFYRWVWAERTDGYTVDVDHDDADAWLRHLARREVSNAHRSNCRKAVMMLFKWRHHCRGQAPYEPALQFTTGSGATNPREFLTRSERVGIREAALEFGSVPAYDGLSSSERDRWKAYLAQRFEKPKAAVGPSDWDRANGWKIPSLVAASLDAGLRPIEVERAVTSWVDTDNGVLRIPKDQSSKTKENWFVGLREQTMEYLARWLEEREAYSKYDDTDALWLTREGNAYGSKALKDVLLRLCEIAGIDTESRQMSWYAIRHSTGTYMVREEDLAAAQTQLRHKSAKTTMKYDQTPVEDRRDALDRMG